MIKSNKPRNSRGGGERAGRCPYEAEQSPEGRGTSAARRRRRRHPPARPRYTAPGPGTRYSVPGPGSRSRPSPAPRPGLSGAPHGEAPPFPSFFSPLSFSFLPFFPLLFFSLARGRRAGRCVPPRPRRAEPSRLGPALLQHRSATQRSVSAGEGRHRSARHHRSARAAAGLRGERSRGSAGCRRGTPSPVPCGIKGRRCSRGAHSAAVLSLPISELRQSVLPLEIKQRYFNNSNKLWRYCAFLFYVDNKILL